MRAVGRLSIRPSSNAWLSESIQWRFLEEQEKRLDLTFPEEEPLDRVQGPLPALRRVEGTPRGIVDGDIQQRQERRHERLQRPVQRQEFARHSFANLAAGRRAPRCPRYAFSSSMTGRYGVARP